MSAVSFKVGLNEIDTVVEYLKQKIGAKDTIVFLQGDLAAGKTTFVQRFSKQKSVTSPTFSLQNIYADNIYHYDLYTIDFETFMQKALVYELEKSGIHFIEWGDEKLRKFCTDAGFNVIGVKINNLNDKREYIIDEA
jgi:tRNA threonylcarbamoyladenosine biosynthesis protein TsaE